MLMLLDPVRITSQESAGCVSGYESDSAAPKFARRVGVEWSRGMEKLRGVVQY